MRRVREVVAMAVGMAVLLAVSPAAQAGGGGAPQSRRVRCGDTITRNTRLTHDLACPGTNGPALRITRAGVVLDLGGHTVRRSGPDTGGSEGIVVEADSTVRNGTIRGFSWGYIVDSGQDVRLSRLTFIDNWAAVYNRYGSFTNIHVTDCRLLRNRVGLGSEQDAGNGTFKVKSSLFSGNGLAFSANFHSVDVDRSTFSSNELVFWCPDGSVTFRSSLLFRNQVVGWVPLGEFGYGTCYEARFFNTVIAGNGALAPAVEPAWEPFDLVLRDSYVAGNDTGLEARARTLDVRGNTWWENGSGLTVAEPPELLQPSVTGTVSGNRFLRNRGDGLRVTFPGTLTVSGNVAIGNTGWGIHAPGVIDGGGNVARGNGAGDCFGVVCASTGVRPGAPDLAVEPDTGAVPFIPAGTWNPAERSGLEDAR
ncbi:right-handed parallel beta-helix repeat-containing protein [Myxococcus sp. RHSTA-1-4]|uniref:right-handed parallel beta-helix repeat-containing protein n=1 Tax=Myxococcus sp. RHSTA-1-4 TaxID=2874601 RepID=UPI001CBF208D|nr:right-handed parallel beta-helix repeat-containing protein [Myxococcus sp. RHSTA-1-4]MBZ4420110.1 right-handed parallel beta-helix repeat-containing protein [Myxococcus sp. RHSTA-1-4]